MITRLAELLLDVFMRDGIISEDEGELYLYGIFIMLSNSFYLFVSFLIGLLFRNILASIGLYILFALIRNYAGGFHAKSEFQCGAFTIGTLIVSNIGIQMLMKHSEIAMSMILIFSSVFVFLISPVQSAEKPLSQGERGRYRLTARVLVTLYFLTAWICKYLNILMIANTIAMSLLLESIALVAGKTSKK
ncbi:MAG: accessory gene regulator B family protein [Oscillospiraceae bacterium]|nr:accessory gene regulator B family protein [Oscillospiraceae bacterium]